VRLDDLPADIDPQESLISLAPGETKDVSFTFDPTYTFIADGWWPSGYSPANNTLGVTATAASIMGHVFESVPVNITLGIGPKFEITSFSHQQIYDDGDDDGTHESCESYHITVSIINRGDPAWVTWFGFDESDGNLSHGDLHRYDDIDSPFLGAYGLWASGETRTLTNRQIETWLMQCNVNYSGNYKVYPYVHFYLPSDPNQTDYYTTSVNRKLVPVIAFEKTLNAVTYESGPMEFTQLGVDEDEVNLILKNNGDVYYEYGSRGYDSNSGWDQHWYWVMPPGTDANYKVKNARIKIGNSTTINYRYDVRYDWSLFFNELDGGLIVVDAAIEFMVDKAKIKDKLEKFGLDLSARSIVKGIIDMVLERYNQQALSASGILHDIATDDDVQEWLLDRIVKNVIGVDSVSGFYDDVKEKVEFQEWLAETGKSLQDFDNEDSSGKLLMFVKYLADKFKEGVLELFGDDIPFLGSFIDLGEWFGTNLFSTKHIVMHVDIIDPPGEFNVYMSEQPLVFGSANNATNATGYGDMNLTLLGNGSDTRESFYQSSVSPLANNPMLAADFESIEIIIEGARVNGSMVGNVTILFRYNDDPDGTMINTLRNDMFAKPMLEQFFSDMTYHMIDITVNNTLRYYGEGTFNMFAVSPYDDVIHTTVSSTANSTTASIDSTGNYSETVGNETTFTANFAPAFGISLEDTNLSVTMPENNTLYNGGQNGTGTLQFNGIPEEGLEIVSGNVIPSTDGLAPKIEFRYPLESNRVITAGEDIIYAIDEQHPDKALYAFDGAGYAEMNYTGVVKTNGLSLGAHNLSIIANDSFGYEANNTLEFRVIEPPTTTTTTTTSSSTTSTTTTTTSTTTSTTTGSTTTTTVPVTTTSTSTTTSSSTTTSTTTSTIAPTTTTSSTSTTTTSTTPTIRPNPARVYGWITKQGSIRPVAGADVSVHCMDNGKNTSTHSNYWGMYMAYIDCPSNSQIRVDSESGDYYGSSYERINRAWFVNVNVYLKRGTTTTTTTSTTTTSSTTTTTTTTIPTTTTTTTSTTTIPHATSTSTTIPRCVMPGNDPPCNVVSMKEVLNAIKEWTHGNMHLYDVIALLNSWSNPVRYPPN
jgi:hypothetical protein